VRDHYRLDYRQSDSQSRRGRVQTIRPALETLPDERFVFGRDAIAIVMHFNHQVFTDNLARQNCDISAITYGIAQEI
jgi:hypothetical protein